MEACAVALLTSLCSFCLPLLTACTPCPDPEKFPDVECPRHDTYFGNFVSFNCASGAEYNDLATLFFNTQVSAGALFHFCCRFCFSCARLLFVGLLFLAGLPSITCLSCYISMSPSFVFQNSQRLTLLVIPQHALTGRML